MLTLGLLLGGLEQSLGRHTWRNASRAVVAYLTALSHWGYPLSDVERLAVEPDADRSLSADAEHDDAEDVLDRGDGEPADSPHQTDAERDEVGGDAGHPAEADTDVDTAAAWSAWVWAAVTRWPHTPRPRR